MLDPNFQHAITRTSLASSGIREGFLPTTLEVTPRISDLNPGPLVSGGDFKRRARRIQHLGPDLRNLLPVNHLWINRAPWNAGASSRLWC